MVFSSHIFLYYFLPIALAAYYMCWKAPQIVRNGLLALLGYIFYGWANPKFVPLMFATTFVDWFLSMAIARDSWLFWRRSADTLDPLPKHPRSSLQRTAITLSVVSNLVLLAFFKYFNLGIDSYNELVAGLGLSAWRWDSYFRVVLPLGISFYVFQSLSYTIDVYRGDARAMRNFLNFACFVSMFPHLVAGPILKFSFLAEQLEHRVLTLDKFARGVTFVALGMAKKVLIANPCGKVADLAFDAGSLTRVDAWYGLFAYAFQIFFDFSAYSDMAIGLGLMLGFVFARNFDAPYRSQSITEFWRRWHISLSTWLREYLYIPLGGNRRGDARTYLNLLVTMLLGGLWHGASWNFLIWGGVHGGALAVERACRGTTLVAKTPRVLRVVCTFAVVLLVWVFFRASTLPQAVAYFACMFGLGAGPSPAAPLLAGVIYQPCYLLAISVAAIAVWVLPDTWEWTQRLSWLKVAACLLAFAVSLSVLRTQSFNPFIYFIF